LQTKRIKTRPDLDIKKPEYAEKEVQPLTPDEVHRLLDAAEYTRVAKTKNRKPFVMRRATAKRDVTIIATLTDTGMRVGKMCRLVRSDVDLDESTITVQAYGTGRKTKERIIDIGKNTRMAIFEYLLWREEREGRQIEKDDIIFLTVNDEQMNRDTVRHVINEIADSAGISNVHPHRFRHTFASERAADDMGESHLKYLLGQTSDKMARRYVHLHNRSRARHTSPIDKIRQMGREDRRKGKR
jgi:integrase